MTFKLFQRVQIVSDLSDEGIQKGEKATVVEVLQTKGVETAYMVELSHKHPHPLGVVTVTADQIEPAEAEVPTAV